MENQVSYPIDLTLHKSDHWTFVVDINYIYSCLAGVYVYVLQEYMSCRMVVSEAAHKMVMALALVFTDLWSQRPGLEFCN